MIKPGQPGAYTFENLCSMENLWEAARRARRGKRFHPAVSRFHHNLGDQLVRLRDDLLTGSYQPGPYHTFQIYEPAHRHISAAPYRDRVVHHALCQITEPLFERGFIADSYANRKGYGTHRALDRCTEYARRFPYVLQCDIRLFFPSIDHEILARQLARRIWDKQVLALARTILDHSNPQPAADFYFAGDDLFTPGERRKGLPIGNLTSQFWANVHLDPFDHFVRDELGVPGYVRYVDDFLIFGHDKGQLAEWRDAMRDRLAQLRLVLHPRKTRLYPVSEGIPFLGFRVFPRRRRLLPEAVQRTRRRFGRLSAGYERGELGMAEVFTSLRAWIAHAAHGDTKALRRRLLAGVVLRARGRIRACGGARGTTITTTLAPPIATTINPATVTTTTGFVVPVHHG